MKWLILAVIIFSQQPAEAPKGKGAAEPDHTESAAHTKKTEANQTQSAQPAPIPPQSSTAIEGERNTAAACEHTAKNNQQTSDEDRATQRKLTWFTGILAGVGVLQLAVMFLTWLVYRRQAEIMANQSGEITLQREAMQGQLAAMQGQLTQMGTAGRQTDALIEQATKQADALSNSVGAMYENVEASRRIAAATLKSANAAKDSAAAAILNAQAVINSDRPWVVIFAIKTGGLFSFHAANLGRTPAEIISFNRESRLVQNFNEIPPEPTYGVDYAPRMKLLVPSGPAPDREEFELLSVEDFENSTSGMAGSRKVAVFYFRVRYGNPLSRLIPEVPSYESRTCFAFAPSHAGEILSPWGNDAYNSHT